MKRILTALLLLSLTWHLGAQSKEVAGILKQYDKAKVTLNDAKKGANASNWIKYAEVVAKAYNQPTANLWVGLSSLEAKVILKEQRSLSSEITMVQGEEYELVKYPDKDLYYNTEGKLTFWVVTQPVLKDTDALQEMYNAYLKATELDAKGSQKKAIQEGLTNLTGYLVNDAMADYSLGDFSPASKKFEMAFNCGMHPSVNNADTTFLYYAGLTASLAKEPERARDLFQQTLDMGFLQNGDTYANLADVYKQLGDVDKCKELLSAGFTHFPDSQSILVALINAYMETNDDPNKVLEFIHAAQANEPNNPSLFYAEGNILKNLGNFEEAIDRYKASVQVDPSYSFGYYSIGVAYYDHAVDLQMKANDELDDNKYMALIEDMDKTLEMAISPLEQCYEMSDNPDMQAVVIECLKNIYFRLRDKSPEYTSLYEKYNTLFQAVSQKGE